MEKIITKDNAVTFFSEQYQEWYHSKSGAVEEAREKFAVPCKIAEKAVQEKIVLLDICFGLGYNTTAAIESIKKINPSCEISVYALENDLRILEKIEDIEVVFSSYPLIKEMVKIFLKEKKASIKKENITLHVLLGDAREQIKKVQEPVDAVFLDPFSPKVCPELWTKNFFADIKKVMKKDAMLATYSCARVVRDNFKAAGFSVKDGPCIGRRAPSTIAHIYQEHEGGHQSH